MSARGLCIATVLLLVLAATACTEENSTLVTDIGTVGFLLTDPGLSSQVVSTGVPPEYTIQDFEWRLTAPADLSREDGVKEDLLFGEPCAFVQTTKSRFNPEGRCSGGIILGSSDDLGSVSPPADVIVDLDMTVHWMQVRRAKPLELPDGQDYDADGVSNEVDNCPLLPNNQSDSNEDGVGDACSVRDFFGNTVADNDGDGVADGSDNCVWYRNPGQEDTTGIAAEYGIPDGIGDACEEQRIANIRVLPGGGSLPVDLKRQFTVGLATGGLSFVTVDFDNTITLENCDWEAGTCDLIPSNVEACGVLSNINLALAGCEGQTTNP